jgi:hypothetical protein
VGEDRDAAELVLEVGDDPDGWAPPISVREGGKERSWRAGRPLGWGEGERKQLLGRAARGGRRKQEG